MKSKFNMTLALFLAPAIYAQKIVPDKTDNAKPGQTITLKLVGAGGKGDVLSWATKSGKGTIRVGSDPRTIEFTPDAASEDIIVVCVIVPLHGSKKEAIAQIKLQAGGSGSVSASTASPAVVPPPGSVKPAIDPPPQHAAPSTDGYIEQLGFIPAGFMGSAQEGATVDLNQGHPEDPHSPPTCIRLAYTPEPAQSASPQSKVTWFAIAWQFTNGEPNFGDSPGKDLESGVDESSRFRSLRIWARGDLTSGKPPVVQFKSGGGTKRGLPEGQRASYEVVDQFRPLTPRWTEYCLSLRDKKLRNVVSAFTIVMERAGNPNGAVVYLDDIHFSEDGCPAGLQ
ncbi:hypothetical protein [Paludibaculum fermentans]|uniref:hypothetical protein n=1 Tax=Paludibaculum fermentans TaxID=1473598 RepID=UPI003EBD0735